MHSLREQRVLRRNSRPLCRGRPVPAESGTLESRTSYREALGADHANRNLFPIRKDHRIQQSLYFEASNSNKDFHWCSFHFWSRETGQNLFVECYIHSPRLEIRNGFRDRL